MKGKGTLVLTTLILILSFSVNLELNSQMNVEASNGYPVHNLNTGLNYTSIQVAINANETLNGHTIFVEEGNYSEIVYVNKSISIIGEDKHNTTISGNTAGQIIWVLADNVTITGFTIHNRNPWEGYAIYLGSNYNIIHSNIIRNSAWGISVGSSYNIISKNSIRNNRWGLDFVGGSNNVVQSNNISNNTVAGIGLGYAYWNIIYDNTITENTWGFRMPGSSNNTICRNKIADNGGESGGGAIFLHDFPSDNRFYQNNFINNKYQTHFLNVYSNIWDNGFEGNYWSDYNGTDLDNDGIGNTPYIIDANNTDHFPLMGMFSCFNATSEHQVETISNSSIADFNFNGTSISFNVSGEGMTFGFSRLCIPRALMNETFRIFVNGTEVAHNLLPISNSTHSYLYFSYEHSTKEVMIVPEFSSLIILPLLMTLTLILILAYRKTSKTHKP